MSIVFNRYCPHAKLILTKIESSHKSDPIPFLSDDFLHINYFYRLISNNSILDVRFYRCRLSYLIPYRDYILFPIFSSRDWTRCSSESVVR